VLDDRENGCFVVVAGSRVGTIEVASVVGLMASYECNGVAAAATMLGSLLFFFLDPLAPVVLILPNCYLIFAKQ
jgi:hypothetical protein